jgi:tetratricopeptide (TPR) repeat protein
LLNLLVRFSLLAYEPASRALSISPLIQCAALDSLEQRRASHLAAALSFITARMPPPDFQYWPIWSERFPHASCVVNQLDPEDLELKHVTLLSDMAAYAFDRGDLPSAERFAYRVVQTLARLASCDAVDLARARDILGSVLVAQNQIEAGLEVLICAFATIKAALGENHPDVAMSAVNLGSALHLAGRREEGLKALRHAVEVLSVAPGRQAECAQATSNLAGMLKDCGERREAEELFRTALMMRESCCGVDHPSTAGDAQNLADLLMETGRLGEALPLQRRALEIRTRTLTASSALLQHTILQHRALCAQLGTR